MVFEEVLVGYSYSRVGRRSREWMWMGKIWWVKVVFEEVSVGYSYSWLGRRAMKSMAG